LSIGSTGDLVLAVLVPLWTTAPALLQCTGVYASVKPVLASVCVGSTGAWFSVLVVSRVNCTGVSPIAPALVSSDHPVLDVSSLLYCVTPTGRLLYTGSTGALISLLQALLTG
jgi:hypothetical protein